MDIFTIDLFYKNIKNEKVIQIAQFAEPALGGNGMIAEQNSYG